VSSGGWAFRRVVSARTGPESAAFVPGDEAGVVIAGLYEGRDVPVAGDAWRPSDSWRGRVCAEGVAIWLRGGTPPSSNTSLGGVCACGGRSFLWLSRWRPRHGMRRAAALHIATGCVNPTSGTREIRETTACATITSGSARRLPRHRHEDVKTGCPTRAVLHRPATRFRS